MEPEEISRILEAYEQALHILCVKDRDDLPLSQTYWLAVDRESGDAAL
jgi:hypothetical protein